MKEKTWVEKVSEEKSEWLLATRLEREGNLEEAAEHYLREARRQDGKNAAMAALGYLSAAKCLLRVGRRDEALELFRLAGDKYREYAESTSSIAPTSTVWGYRMAAKCYMWAEEYETAQRLMEIADSISGKVSSEPSAGDVPLFKPYRGKKRDAR